MECGSYFTRTSLVISLISRYYSSKFYELLNFNLAIEVPPSSPFVSPNILKHRQIVPAMLGLFAYKAAALVQVYRDNEDLKLFFPDSDESSDGWKFRALIDHQSTETFFSYESYDEYFVCMMRAFWFQSGNWDFSAAAWSAPNLGQFFLDKAAHQAVNVLGQSSHRAPLQAVYIIQLGLICKLMFYRSCM